MFSYKKVSPIFHISTLFVLIPLIHSFDIEYGEYLFFSSVMFLLSYLVILYTDNKIVDLICWIYMNLYIILTAWVNSFLAMFASYLLNLITWHYQEKSLVSPRVLSMWFTLSIIILISLTSGVHIIDKIVIISTISVSVAMFVVIKFYREQELLKESIYEKNKSINFLLADNERNRISRDLHDTLGHVFTALSMKSELALTLLRQGKIDLIEKELIEIQQVSNAEMKNVRKIIEGIQNRSIDEELKVIQNILAIAGIQFNLEYDSFHRISIHVQNHLTMILRELINNLLKHAKANFCSLILKNFENKITIQYQDNGIGFDVISGKELSSIRNRLAIIKGKIEFRSLSNPTRIEIIVPLEVV